MTKDFDPFHTFTGRD